MAEITAKTDSPIQTASPVATSAPQTSSASDAPKPQYDPETGGMVTIDPETGEKTPYDPTAQAGYVPTYDPTVEKVDFTSPPQTDEERERELQAALDSPLPEQDIFESDADYAARVAADTQSREDIRQKLSLAAQIKTAEQSWQESDGTPPPEVQAQLTQAKALVYGKIAPFVDLGRQTINIAGALRVGVSAEQLLAAGANEGAVNQERARQHIQQKYNGDPLKAIEGGDIEAVRALGIAPDQELAGVKSADWQKLSYEEQVGLTLMGMQTKVADARVQARAIADFESRLLELPKFLQDAYRTGGVEGYNAAVAEYNQVIQEAQTRASGPVWTTKEADERFQAKYARILQPSNMSDADYAKIAPFITIQGIYAKRAYEARVPVDLINRFVFATSSDEFRQKVESGETVLLPYGSAISSSEFNELPSVYQQTLLESGFPGLEAKLEQDRRANEAQSVWQNTLDAIVMAGTDIATKVKGSALQNVSWFFEKQYKEGDLKPGYAQNPQLMALAGSTARFTAEEAERENRSNQKIVDDIQSAYDKAQKARENWIAENPLRQPVFPDGPLQAAKDNPASLLNPLLYTETVANTLPYTAAGVVLIAGGGALGGVPGAVAGGAVAFGFTMAVEGHDIYRQAIEAGDTREHARMLMNLYGALSAAVETAGDAVFVGMGTAAFKTVTGSLGKNVAKGVIEGAAKQYGWKNLTADVIVNFINQSSQEAVQEIITNAAVRTVDENRPLLEGAVDSFVAGAIGTAPFVLIPASVSGAKLTLNSAKEMLKDKASYDVEPAMQAMVVDRALGQTEGFVNTQMIKDTAKAREVAALYNEVGAKTKGYADISLLLKQTRKAMSDMSAEDLEVTSRQGEDIFNRLKEQEKQLTNQLKELAELLKTAVDKFTSALLESATIGDETIRKDIEDMSKNIVRDIDTLTSQVMGDRDVLEINKEIQAIEAQIQELRKVLEGKELTLEQRDALGKLVSVLNVQIQMLEKEAYNRYLGTGEEVTLTKAGELKQEIRTLAQNLIETSGIAEPTTKSKAESWVRRLQEQRKAEEATIAAMPSTREITETTGPSAKERAIRLGAEREFFDAMQSVYESIWGKKSYGEALSKLEGELETLLASLETLPEVKPTKIITDIFGAIKKRDPKQFRGVVRLLQLEAGKISPTLQISAGQFTQTAEDLMNQFRYRPVSKPSTRKFEQDVDLESLKVNKIRQQVERIIADNWQKLTERLSSSILRRSPQEIREYLEERFGKDYVNDLLDPDRVEQDLRDELRRQEDLEQRKKDIELHETEQKLSESFRDKTTNPDTKKNLDEHAKELKRQVEQKKKALQVAEKEKLVIPLTQVRELAGRVKEEEALTTKKETALAPTEKEKPKTKRELDREEQIKERVKRARRQVEREQRPAEGETTWAYSPYLRYLLTTAGAIQTKGAEWISPEQAIKEVQKLAEQELTRLQEQLKQSELTQQQLQIQLQQQISVQQREQIQEQLQQQEQLQEQLQEQVQQQQQQRRIIRFPIILPKKGDGENQQGIPAGSIAYKKGLFWKYIPPPYDQPKPITLKRGVSPIGADLSGGNSPYTTIQKIGESDAPVPERIAVDEGVTDSFISLQGSKIVYSGKGEQTNVGVRVDSPTQGMTVNGDGEGISRPAMTDYYAPKSVSRPHIATQKEPSRAVREIRGVDRPDIAEKTEAMLEGTYEEPAPEPETKTLSLDDGDELGEYGTYWDERIGDELEPEIMRQPKHRILPKQKPPRRGRDDSPPTMLRGMRL